MATVEDRLNALETEVAVLRGKFVPSDGSWIEAVAGSFRDEPEFDEVLRLGREARQRDFAGESENSQGS